MQRQQRSERRTRLAAAEEEVSKLQCMPSIATSALRKLISKQISFVNLRLINCLILPYKANVMRSTALVRCLRPAVLRPQLPVAVHCRRLSGEVTKKASASGGDVTVEPLKNERGEVRETHHPHSQPT